MNKITVTIYTNTTTTLNCNNDYVAHLDRDNLIELYDNSADAPDELTEIYNGDPETERSFPVDERVKYEMVIRALDEFWEDKIVDYVNDYLKKHIDDLEDLQAEYAQSDRDEAEASYLESRYEDY